MDVLERIWNLADTQQAGALTLPEFVIAMHLLTSFKSGAMRALPTILPPGLYDAAARLVQPRASVSRSASAQLPPELSHTPIPRQFSGQSAPRPQSPLRSAGLVTTPLSAQATGTDWAVTPADKAQFDSIFANVDKAGRGYISGDDAVRFFGNSKLPAEVLAQIWDLSCIQSNGQLNRDEFAVAMYLIRQQRAARDGGNTLPPVLPPNLVPPGMRQPSRSPSQSLGFGSVTQPPAPAPAPAPPRSAADDLFGLDVLTQPAPAPVQTQTTGGSASFGLNSAPSAVVPDKPRAQSPQAAESSVFKPFIPSSSWGQNIVATHPTGTSAMSDRNLSEPVQSPPMQSQPMQSPTGPSSAADDLLSDHDPEINKKLTAETAELGNLSNQVGILSNQMQEVKSKRASAETELSKATAQKRDFEIRLAQLRTVYEKEVEAVRNLEEQLNTCRNETAKIRRDVAMIEGTYEDLQHQHQHAVSALEADQKENAQLKEKIRGVNAEMEALKPQLEKAKSDGRQTRGLVAINKKQLSTVEGERDRLQNEVQEAKKANEGWPGESNESTATAMPASTMVSSPDVTSPSTNPFSRLSPGVESPFSPGANHDRSAPAHPHASAFDDLFGPSFNSQASAGPAPPTSFAGDTSPGQQDGASALPNSATPAPAGRVEEGASLRGGVDQRSSGSTSTTTPSQQLSSTTGDTQQPQPQGAGPGSSMSTSSLFSALDRPSGDDPSTSHHEGNDPAHSMSWATENLEASGTGTTDAARSTPPVSNSVSDEDRAPVTTTSGGSSSFFSIPRMPRDAIPGAFPEQFSTPMEEMPGNEFPGPSKSVDDGKGATDLSQMTRSVTSSSKDDFDAAFAEFDAPAKPPRQTNGVLPTTTTNDGAGGKGSKTGSGGGGGGGGQIDQEFPPIQELEIEDESDSDEDQRFDDDFTPVSPSKPADNSVRPQESEAAAPVSDSANAANSLPPRPSEESNVNAPPLHATSPNQTTSPFPDTSSSSLTKSPSSTSDGGRPSLAPSYLASHPFKTPNTSNSTQSPSVQQQQSSPSQQQQQQQQQGISTLSQSKSGFDDDFDDTDFADLAPAQEESNHDKGQGSGNELGRGGVGGSIGDVSTTTTATTTGEGETSESLADFDLAFDVPPLEGTGSEMNNGQQGRAGAGMAS